MTGNRKIVVFLLAIFIISISCRTAQGLADGSFSLGGGQTDTPRPTTAPPVVPNSEPEVTVINVPPPTLMPGLLFIEEFTDAASGWPVETTETSVTEYADGGYRITLNAPESRVVSTVGPTLGNVRILVDAVLVDGGLDNYYGLMCRYLDGGNFYMGLITSDGFYAIVKYQEGAPTFLSSDRFQESIVINQGNSLNLMEMSCIGSQISLTVNGQQIALVEDDGISAGDVGMVVGTISAESTSILFDNFTLYLEED
jgi:hypothetical protein